MTRPNIEGEAHEQQRRRILLQQAISRAISHNIFLLVAVAVAALVLWFAWSVLLYAFCGILLAVAFRGCVVWTSQKTGLGEKASYAIVLLGSSGILVLGIWLLAPRVANQASEIQSRLPQAWSRLHQNLEAQSWGRWILNSLGKHSISVSSIFSSVGTEMIDMVAGLIAALVVGLYGAADPRSYVGGLLQILPAKRRTPATALVNEVGNVLKWWTLGQLVPMSVLGVATMIGLWLMHIPLAFTLGLFTGVMIFIPYVGAWLAAIPAALMGLLESPSKMIWVLVFFLAVHICEGYALTPLVQRRTVRLPPVLTIVAQVFMWTVGGVLGVLVATPLTAAALVIVRRLVREQRKT